MLFCTIPYTCLPHNSILTNVLLPFVNAICYGRIARAIKSRRLVPVSLRVALCEPRDTTKMPGYKPLPSSVTGPEADQVRQAESRRRGGDADSAVHLLEDALAASLELRQEIPGWLCGRLAALYRTLGRYDDEVHLLERYRESQRTEEARTRYDARLSKARIIAERKRRRDSGALQSVRVSMSRPNHRRPALVHESTELRAPVFSRAAIDTLTLALAADSTHDTKRLDDALALVCAEAHANDTPVEELVAVLRGAAAALRTSDADGPRNSRYDSALLLLLALYYKEQQS
jgi:hypothetical protein